MNDIEAIRRVIALYPQLLDAKRRDDWGGCSPRTRPST
jgi:hypothetical protein